MAGGKFYPLPIKKGEGLEQSELAKQLDETFADVKKTLDTLGIARGTTVEITDSGSAAVEFTVAHKLGVVPDGYIVVYADQVCNVYDSGTTWTTDNIYLMCGTANCHIKVLVFVNTDD